MLTEPYPLNRLSSTIRKLEEDFSDATRHLSEKNKHILVSVSDNSRNRPSPTFNSRWHRAAREGIPLEIAIRNFDLVLSRYVKPLDESELKEQAARLGQNAPPQVLGPAQFEVYEQKIRVVRAPSASPLLSKDHIEALHKHIISKHDLILELLSQSNFDKRIMSQFRILGEAIKKGSNAIIIGLENINAMALMAICDKDELSSIQAAKIFTHLEQISMYVAQFSEWNQFQSNYQSANTEQINTENLKETITSVLEKTDILEEDAVSFFARIKHALGSQTKASLHAAATSLQNLCLAILKYGINFIADVHSDLRPKLVKTTSRVAYAGILYLGLSLIQPTNIISLSPAALNWANQVAEIIKRELTSLSQ